jgi:branched-chain amino acid transport system ATP-binding protein
MLELTAVNVRYGKRPVLREVALEIGEGEVVALIGANAAGKTTTLRSIMGLKELASGGVRFAGRDITRLATVERVRLGVTLSPEGRQVFTKFTVLENLTMGGYHRQDRNRLDHDIDRVFSLFPRLAERRHQSAGSMSGGEQQMLAIGRALIARPRCLLLDEPTLGLAPIVVE